MDLATLIRRVGPLPLGRVREIAHQVCAALEYAHGHGVVHRDLKSANIVLVSREGGDWAKVVDFGISKAMDTPSKGLTLSGAVVGTPEYMSPEQLAARAVDGRSDLYSLGIVLYEALCGRVPFEGPVSAVLVAQAVEQPPLPTTFRPDLPAAVEEVVLRALAKQPERRFATAKEMERHFAAACDEAKPESTAAYETPRPRPSPTAPTAQLVALAGPASDTVVPSLPPT